MASYQSFTKGRWISNLGLEIYHCDVKMGVSRLALYGWRGLNAVTVILRLFTGGSLKGRSPFKTNSLPFDEVNTKGELKRGEASLT